MMQTEYARRRARIFEKLESKSLVVLPGAQEQYRNGDVSYPFRQNSDFYYLTGFSEPEAVLVLLKTQSENKVILFCKPYCAKQAIWTGPSAGLEGAKEAFGMDESYPFDSLDEKMPALCAEQQKIFYSFGKSMLWDRRFIKWAYSTEKASKHKPLTVVDFLSLVSEARLIKSPSEIALIRKAVDISVQAHKCLMQTCAHAHAHAHAHANVHVYADVGAISESQLEALFAYECAKGGCRSLAYPSIVGGGSNACILHYVQNDKPLCKGDLVLVDAGAEYQGYASDITRTFPVSGQFSTDQKSLYNIVLEAQLATINAVRPGTPWDDLQSIVVEHLTKGLVALGILHGTIDQLIETKAYQTFYPHSSGHWLGLDVHDVGSYKQEDKPRMLQAGMVLTVEPGLYIPKDCQTVDPRWRGIGIRIEDDVLVTQTGYEVLSAALPKTVEEIERLMEISTGSVCNE